MMGKLGKIHIIGFLFSCFAIGYPIVNVSAQNVVQDESETPEPEVVEAELWMLTPPEGFVASKNFNGYIHYQVGAAIIMHRMVNTLYVYAKQSIDSLYLAENKLTKIAEGEFVSDKGIGGVYYKCHFSTNGMDYVRYVVFAGDLKHTLWLNITYPKMAEVLIDGPILESFRTITLTQNEDGR